MAYMFAECRNLKSINYLETSAVTNMTNIFLNCAFDSNGYDNLVNFLPEAMQLNNSLIANMGLNYNNLSSIQQETVNIKHYLDYYFKNYTSQPFFQIYYEEYTSYF